VARRELYARLSEDGSERAGDVGRLAIVHVSSQSRQRHKVATVIVFASVSTRLPWQNGHLVGRAIASLNRNSDIVAVSPFGFSISCLYQGHAPVH
jgi:hypothetical protein